MPVSVYMYVKIEVFFFLLLVVEMAILRQIRSVSPKDKKRNTEIRRFCVRLPAQASIVDLVFSRFSCF